MTEHHVALLGRRFRLARSTFPGEVEPMELSQQVGCTRPTSCRPCYYAITTNTLDSLPDPFEFTGHRRNARQTLGTPRNRPPRSHPRRTDHRTHRSEHRGPSPTPERPHPADADNTERPAETMTTNSRTACPICSMTRPRRHSVSSPVATHTAAAANRLRSCEWMARSVHGSANFSKLRHAQDRHPAISRCHSVATIQW